MKSTAIALYLFVFMFSSTSYGQQTDKKTYELYIPNDMLKNEKFEWGLQKISSIPDDNPDYTILLQEYKLYYKLNGQATEKAHYFKYRKNDDKNYLYASDDFKGKEVSFLIGYMGFPSEGIDISFENTPSDKNNEVQPLDNLLKDAIRAQIFDGSLDPQLLNNTNILYRLTDDEMPVIIIGNSSNISKLSFNTPTAYFYVDMSGVENRDMLIKEISNQIKELENLGNSFFMYVSNGKDPIIIKNITDFNKYISQLWTLTPPNIPSSAFDKDELRRNTLYDISYSLNNVISFHFYFSDKFLNSFGQKFVDELFPDVNKQKLKLFIHMEPSSDNDAATSFCECEYEPNKAGIINSSCLKKISTKGSKCTCK